jgi:hypothetical protein
MKLKTRASNGQESSVKFGKSSDRQACSNDDESEGAFSSHHHFEGLPKFNNLERNKEITINQ